MKVKSGEERAIKATKEKSPHTIESLRDDLRRLGVAEGDVLIVHTSMSAIGWVCGGAQAVIEALLAAVGPGGTIVMPAHTAENSDPALWRRPPVPKAWWQTIRETMPAFEPAKTPTRGMGVIAELFRTWPGTLRSGHPHGSFCVNGPLAGQICARHALTPMWGEESPLGALYGLGAKTLLIGVGYSRCTCLHLAEVRAGIARMPWGLAMLEDGGRVWKTYEDCDYGSTPYGRIGQRFEDKGGASTGLVGSAKSHLCPVRALVDYATERMREKIS